jgi:hypothetical protein
MPAEDHYISLKEAVELTTNFRANRETILAAEYRETDVLSDCETLDKEALRAFMDNEHCKSIRIYSGMTDALQVKSILVGVNENGEDMIDGAQVVLPLVNRGNKTPPDLIPISVLNS